MIDLTRARADLAELGHTLDWRLVGPVADNRPGDPGWEAVLDGKVIARGGALGTLAAEFADALERCGFDVHAWQRPARP